MNIQRLRNLTTGRLHTDISHVYQDVEFFTGEQGFMTHMLPRAFRALEPFLREAVADPRFWDGNYDTTHVGEIEVAAMNEQQRAEFWKRYSDQPDPLAGKNVVVVQG